MSNRDDRIIASKIHDAFKASSDKLLFNELEEYKISLTHSENKPEEISQFMVESITKSVATLIKSSITPTPGMSNLEKVQSVFLDNSICGLYHWIEKIWEDCLWNGYAFIKNDNSFLIAQTSADHIHSSKTQSITEYRRNIIILHKASIIGSFWQKKINPAMRAGLMPIKLVSQKKVGKKKHFVLSASDSPQNSETSLIGFLAKDMINLEYYADLLNESPKELGGNSVHQLINTWLVLRSLSKASSNRYQGNAITSPAGLLCNAPTFTTQEITQLIVQCTSIKLSAVANIIEFLTFTGKTEQSLYSQPIINLGNDTLTFSSSATHQANPLYVLERWLAQLSLNISKKGSPFEQHVRRELNNADISPLIKDHFQVLNNGLKFSPGIKGERSEEIDLVFIIGTTVFIGEIKCNIGPTEPVDFYNNREILLGAVEQVKRKQRCVQKFIPAFRTRLAKQGIWVPESFKIEAIVIVNNIINSGFPVNEVPITDLLILTSYLSGELIDRARSDTSGHITTEHIVKHYDSLSSAESNFIDYLKHPPQLRHIQVAPRFVRVPIEFIDESFPVTHYSAFESSVSLEKVLETQHQDAIPAPPKKD